MALAQERYLFRKERVRKKVSGTSEKPRLSVFKSLKHIYVQAIDDAKGATLAAASSQDTEIKSKFKSSGNIPAAQAVGQLIAQRCLDKKIKKVVFDRGGRIYHGVIKAVADAAREGGLEF